MTPVSSSPNRFAILHHLAYAATLILAFGTTPASAELENQLEPEYAMAVLDYTAKDFGSALKMLNELQKKAPAATEVLELKAITLKAMANEREAASVYRDLIQVKTKEGRDKKEIAPYAFELGVIRYKEKNWKQAETYLSYAIKNGFNADLARFYLGLVQMQTEDWSQAEINLSQTTKSDLDELRPAAHYYLSQVDFKMGYSSDAFGNLLKAKQSAQKYLDREDVPAASKGMATQVKAAAEAALAPLDRAQTFGSFSLLLGYDSNVLFMPSDSTTTGASGKSTAKSTVSAGFGYASSPLDRIQYVPSVRFNFNKNFNEASSTGEFADTTFSLFLTRDALAPIAVGLKTEGTFVFQNQTDTAGAKKYHLYDNSVQFAPYLKWDASPRWSIGAELGYRIIKYSGEDSLSSSLRRSGHSVLSKISAQNKTGRRYFNPIYAFKSEWNSTEGTEYASHLYGFQIVNVMKLGKIDFSQVLEIDRTSYGQSSTDRGDTLVVVSLLASKKIGPRWGLLGSADYTRNTSTEKATYSYDRYTVSAGVGYNF